MEERVMISATRPRDDRDATRLLVIDPRSRERRDARIANLPQFLRAGDLLVVNDAATLPGSLFGRTARGERIEVRLAGPADGARFTAVVFGPGDFHIRTEDRAAPPQLRAGDRLVFDGGASAQPAADARRHELRARVVATSSISNRLIDLAFELEGGALWSSLYLLGTPVQYAYHSETLPLWSVQTAYASRPWAAEMPSAGRPLSFATLNALRRGRIELASLTHAAGLSATGDPQLDAALPLPERYDIPQQTVSAIERTRARGGRVVAVGTTVVRALEGAAAESGELRAGSGVTNLRLGPDYKPVIASGILTGMHSPAESHYALLAAFVPEQLLRDAFEHAERAEYWAHEFGDATLILSDSLNPMSRAA
jgi:S-adenosylmethionine:tRNA ribosyltransferase-isomerase